MGLLSFLCVSNGNLKDIYNPIDLPSLTKREQIKHVIELIENICKIRSSDNKNTD